MDSRVGRAGRYRSKYPAGEVTCLDKDDLPLLHSSLNSLSPVLKVNYYILSSSSEFPSRLDLIFLTVPNGACSVV